MLTQFEMDSISRGIRALESIAEELRNLHELKTQELKELEKKSNAIHAVYEQKIKEIKESKK